MRTGVADTWSNLIERDELPLTTTLHPAPALAPNLSSTKISTSVLLHIKGTHFSVQPLHNKAICSMQGRFDVTFTPADLVPFAATWRDCVARTRRRSRKQRTFITSGTSRYKYLEFVRMLSLLVRLQSHLDNLAGATMLEVDVALGLVHEKEMAVRVACVDFDIAIARLAPQPRSDTISSPLGRLRQTLQLPVSKDAWVSSLATRLNFLNKEHRISVKNDLYALSARMQEVYSPKNATSDVLTLLDERIQEATEFLAMAESLMADVSSFLYFGMRR